MKHNYSLDFYRILCTIVIVLWHGNGYTGGISAVHGYRCVEFFFILSGLLLYRSFAREQQHSSYRFLVHRLGRLYPEYLIAAVCAILVRGVMSGAFDLSLTANELFMTHSIGLSSGSAYNYPAWYVTCLLCASLILYGILSLSRRASARVVLPLIVVLGYSVIWGQAGQLEYWDYVGPISETLLRAFAALSTGILLEMLLEAGFTKNFSRGTICVLEFIFLALFALGLFTDLVSEEITILGAAGLILITADGRGLIALAADRKIFGVIGRYTYSAYLIHATVITGLFTAEEKFFAIGSAPLRAAVLLLVTAAYSAVVYQGMTWLRKRRSAKPENA